VLAPTYVPVALTPQAAAPAQPSAPAAHPLFPPDVEHAPALTPATSAVAAVMGSLVAQAGGPATAASRDGGHGTGSRPASPAPLFPDQPGGTGAGGSASGSGGSSGGSSGGWTAILIGFAALGSFAWLRVRMIPVEWRPVLFIAVLERPD
jgi:hypothetical protein